MEEEIDREREREREGDTHRYKGTEVQGVTS